MLDDGVLLQEGNLLTRRSLTHQWRNMLWELEFQR